MGRICYYRIPKVDDFTSVLIPACEEFFHGRPEQLISYIKQRKIIPQKEIDYYLKTFPYGEDWLYEVREVKESLHPGDYSMYGIAIEELSEHIKGDPEVATSYFEDCIEAMEKGLFGNLKGLKLKRCLALFKSLNTNMSDYYDEMWYFLGYLKASEVSELVSILKEHSFDDKEQKEFVKELLRALLIAQSAGKELIIEAET